ASAAATPSSATRERRAGRWRASAAVAALVILVGLWGTMRVRGGALLSGGTPIRVAVLQGNILQDQKCQPGLRDAIMQRYIEMTREAIGRNAQFILWPESATPEPYEADLARGEQSRRVARGGKRTRIIGMCQVRRARHRAA